MYNYIINIRMKKRKYKALKRKLTKTYNKIFEKIKVIGLLKNIKFMSSSLNNIIILICRVNKIEKIIKSSNLCHRQLAQDHHHNVGNNKQIIRSHH